MGTPRRAGFSRRTFLKGAGATAAATTAVGGVVATVPSRYAAPVAVKLGPRPAPPGSLVLQTTVNGTAYEVAMDPRWTLAELLRDQIGLTGTKVGCDRGECGTCTVLVDGRPVISCGTLAVQSAGHKILTIEGLAQGGKLHPIQQAFVDNHGLACGFCTPGMILSTKALLDKTHQPSGDQIRAALAGNLCRCTGYQKIVESVEAAAKLM